MDRQAHSGEASRIPFLRPAFPGTYDRARSAKQNRIPHPASGPHYPDNGRAWRSHHRGVQAYGYPISRVEPENLLIAKAYAYAYVDPEPLSDPEHLSDPKQLSDSKPISDLTSFAEPDSDQKTDPEAEPRSDSIAES